MLRKVLIVIMAACAIYCGDLNSTSASIGTNRSSRMIGRPVVYYPGTNFDLPEIIVNRDTSGGGFSGYQYPVPPQPPFQQFDDPPIPAYLPPATTYLPPPLSDDTPPQNGYLPPSHDFVPFFDAPPLHTPSSEYLPPHSSPNSLMRSVNMSCLNSGAARFFQATMQFVNRPTFAPIIDDIGSTDSDQCIKGAGDQYHIDLVGSRLGACGVRTCGERSLCVRVRMPNVPGLRVLDDQVMTLHCRLQDPIATHTKRFQLGTVRELKGRALSPSFAGGSTRNIDMQVSLHRRTGSGVQDLGLPQSFGSIVSADSAVHLGDDLVLRTSIRDGDGWKYSRISTVQMQRAAPSPTNGRIVTLLDERGCRVEGMRAVVPEQPRHLSPLVITLPLRAFMFQGAHASSSGPAQPHDDMVLTVRMIACLEPQDCAESVCEAASAPLLRGRSRARRSVPEQSNPGFQESGSSGRGTVADTSRLDFRVVFRENLDAHRPGNRNGLMKAVLLWTGCGICLAGIGVVLIYIRNKLVCRSCD